MAVTKDDLAKFNQFAESKLSNGGIDSITDLFRGWLDAINMADVDAAIREGLADIDAGRTRPHEEFMREVHEKLGLSCQKTTKDQHGNIVPNLSHG